MTNLIPLRYNIASWAQAPECLSNASPDLHISVATIKDRLLNTQIISVEHVMYGTLFAAAVSGDGVIVSNYDGYGNPITWLSTEEILQQLARYGFFITFNVKGNLPGLMISYLMTLNGLGYQHITRMRVVDDEGDAHISVVAFQGNKHPDWLTYPHEVSADEMIKAVMTGTALNVTALTKDMFLPDDWSWLTFVANINDILEENA